MKKFFFLAILLLLFFPTVAFARIGVGVGTGKIQVDQKLKPGIIYQLPSITVINTGDEPSEYSVDAAYFEKQPQFKPPKDWFIFSPQKFYLDPGKAQVVTIKLNLPVRVAPGNYFAFLEGFPLKKASKGNTTIGVAAAAKLYFTVVPGNIFEGMYYKLVSFWNVYSPYPQGALILLFVALAFLWVRKNFNIQIGLRKQENAGPKLSRRERYLQKKKEQDKIPEKIRY